MSLDGKNKITVLLVDDDNAHVNLIRAYLGKGCGTTFALDAAATLTASLESLSSNAYDVILLDLGLPDSSGIDTLFRLTQQVRNIPIVVLTGISDQETGLQAVGHGAQDYLVKTDITETLLKRSLLHAIKRFRLELALRENEKKLNDSERRYREIIEKSPDGFLVVDESGIVKYMNPAAETLFGRSASHFVGQHVSFPIQTETPAEIEIVRHNQNNVIAELRSARVYLTSSEWQGEKAFLVNFRDVTRRKKMEKRLSKAKANLEKRIRERTASLLAANAKLELEIKNHKRSEEKRSALEKQLIRMARMESIATLSAGIAHDFNNILSAIIGYTELSLDEVKKGTHIEDNLQEIYTAGRRAKDLVRQILAFARQTDEEAKPIRIEPIAKEVLKLIRSSIPTSIEIKQDLDSKSLIMGNATQVHQVLMNLCANAAYAMDQDGGTLQLSLKDITVDEKTRWENSGLPIGRYIEITVSDTGSGIDPHIIDKIFEPYYTTKKTGDGTGMGLAMVHGVVESYGGKITVDSTLGKGTAFTIYLPVTSHRKNRQPYESKVMPHGSERILLVDDEAPIAKVSGQILERLGYTVIARTSSIEALEVFRSKPNDFDLVITDMTMPNMSGIQLARELIKARADIPVILCTGYSNKIADATPAEMGIKAITYKPIVVAKLAKTIRDVLDEANGQEAVATLTSHEGMEG